MNKLAIAVIGAASLFALPVFAQTNSNGAASSHSNANNSAANAPMSAADTAQMRQKITSDLEKDGYKDVRVVPNSFLIHAQNKEGQPVVMIINPDSVFAVTSIGNTGNGNPNSTNGNNNSNLGSNGATHNGTTRQ